MVSPVEVYFIAAALGIACIIAAIRLIRKGV